LRHRLQGKNHHRLVPLFALAVALGASLSVTTHANALYILTGVEDSAIVLDGSEKAPDLGSRMIYTASGRSGFDVTLAPGQQVVVQRDDQTLTTRCKRETISQLLDRLDVTLSPLEMVAADLSGEEIVLTIGEDITYYDEVTEPAACETVRVANPAMKEGTEKVVQEGSDGVRTSVYEVVWSNGQEISRQFVEELDSTAVNKVVEYGTAKPKPAPQASVSSDLGGIVNISKNGDGSGTLTLSSGEKLNFSAAKTMTATAYTAGHDGVGYTTATGTTVRVGTVAVDRKVIPLGTRMFIVTNDGIVYGMAVAEDTGVRGNKIDLYHNTYRECIEFGRRSCTVYILK
jgi:3D (Asp-Asp-Asp) domain-containing protein